jgi:UDP-glucose/iron transport system ATP-binding protein
MPPRPRPLNDSRTGMAPLGRLCAGRAGVVGGYCHFSEWTAALALVKDLGFPAEAKAWPITRLSTGERLRLALIRALMVRPKALLLDEPTAALDPASVAAVESLITARVRAGLAVLWVTHDAEQVGRIAHRLLVVKGGEVREEVREWPAASP